MSDPHSEQPAPEPQPRRLYPGFSRVILILGASVAGLRAAITLDRLLIGKRDHRILLVDQNPYHQVRLDLPAVASGSVPPQTATVPIRRLTGARSVELIQGRVESIDLESRTARTTAGDVGYGWLIFALGVEASPSEVPGLDESAAEVWTVDDARRLNERVLGLIRQAAWKLDAEERTKLATIVVVGGSRFGVELAGALAERVRALATHFRLSEGDGRVILVEPAERLLPTDPLALADAASASLARLGVEVRVGSAVVRGWPGGVELASGETIDAGLVVRTSQGMSPALVRASGATIGREGRLLVDREMRVPEQTGVYAAGPGVALIGEVLEGELGDRDFARQGEIAAQNVFAEISDGSGVAAQRRQYAAELGDLVIPIGSSDAVGEVKGLTVAGWRAKLALEASRLAYFEAIGGASGLLAGVASRKPSLGRLFKR